MNECRCDNRYEQVDVSELWIDLKRILRIQLKELVNTIEDAEYAQQSRAIPSIPPKKRNVAQAQLSRQSLDLSGIVANIYDLAPIVPPWLMTDLRRSEAMVEFVCCDAIIEGSPKLNGDPLLIVDFLADSYCRILHALSISAKAFV